MIVVCIVQVHTETAICWHKVRFTQFGIHLYYMENGEIIFTILMLLDSNLNEKN